jgi:hypothetical protein
MIMNSEYVKFWNMAYFKQLRGVIAHALRRWLLSAEARVQTRMTSNEIMVGSVRAEQDCIQVRGFPLLIAIPPLFHTHV